MTTRDRHGLATPVVTCRPCPHSWPLADCIDCTDAIRDLITHPAPATSRLLGLMAWGAPIALWALIGIIIWQHVR